MRTNTFLICVLLLFTALARAQNTDCESFTKSAHDLAVLDQIISQGGTYDATWNCENPRRLVYLNCSYNQLISLDVSGCKALKYLFCRENKLNSLNISGCSALVDLICYDNQLTSLDVSGYSALTWLGCSGNQLTSLDVSGCSALKQLYCDNNKLTNLIINECSALYALGCYDNQLTNLNTNGCSALSYLDCHNNQLSDSSLKLFYGLNLGCDPNNNEKTFNLKGNKCFSEQAIRSLAENLPCLTYEQIHWDPCINSNPFSFENNWTVSNTPGMPEHPIGVVADGCSAIKINLTQKK